MKKPITLEELEAWMGDSYSPEGLLIELLHGTNTVEQLAKDIKQYTR